MTLRYNGTFTVTLFDGGAEETHLNRLDAGVWAVLGAIWRRYTYHTMVASWPLGYEPVKAQLMIDVAREAMANLVVGQEHIHTDACLFDRDCPIFKAGYEEAQEMVHEWADPDLLR